MAEYIKQDEFVKIALENSCDPHTITEYIKTNLYAEYSVNITNMRTRIANYQRKGLLPLESGNNVGKSEILKGTSTLYDDEGNIIQQWVKTEVPKQQALENFELAIAQIAENLTPIPTINPPVITENMNDLMTIYPIGDAHVGMMAWAKETGEDHDLEISKQRLTSGVSLAVKQALPTREAFIIDVGELIAV